MLRLDVYTNAPTLFDRDIEMKLMPNWPFLNRHKISVTVNSADVTHEESESLNQIDPKEEPITATLNNQSLRTTLSPHSRTETGPDEPETKGNKENTLVSNKVAKAADIVHLRPGIPVTCAGFKKRVLAVAIDQLIFVLITCFVVLPIWYGAVFYLRLYCPDAYLVVQSQILSSDLGVLILSLLNLAPVAQLFYFALFDSSVLQGTPGKRFLGLQVVSESAGRLTFKQCLYKSILSLAAFFIPTWMLALFGSLNSVWVLLPMYALLCYGVVSLNKHHQTILDNVTGRFVIETTNKSARFPLRIVLFDKLLVAGSVAGLAWVIAAYLFFDPRFGEADLSCQSKIPQPNHSGRVAIATHDLHAGQLVSPNDFRVVDLGRLRTPLTSTSGVNLGGAILKSDVFTGQMFAQYNCYVRPVQITSVQMRGLTTDEQFRLRMEECQRMQNIAQTKFDTEQVHYTRAWVYNQHGDYDKALAELKSSFMTLPVAHARKAAALSGLGRQTEALAEIAVKAMKDYPAQDGERSEAYGTRAQILGKLGKLSQAKQDLEEAEKWNRTRLASNFYKEADHVSDPAEQLSLYSKAISADPNFAPAFEARRDLYSSEKPPQLQAALADANAVISILASPSGSSSDDSDDPDELSTAYRNRSDIYGDLQQYDNAARDEEKSEQLIEQAKYSGSR